MAAAAIWERGSVQIGPMMHSGFVARDATGRGQRQGRARRAGRSCPVAGWKPEV